MSPRAGRYVYLPSHYSLANHIAVIIKINIGRTLSLENRNNPCFRMTIELRIPLLSQSSLQMPFACDLPFESALTPLLPKDHVETCHWPLTQTVLCSLSLVRDSYQHHCLGHNLASSLLTSNISFPSVGCIPRLLRCLKL